MRIDSVHIKNFKRFTDLRIQNIPATAKLVVLLGPNGCGKSSLFDAMHRKSYEYNKMGHGDDPDYYFKVSNPTGQRSPINIEFHDAPHLDQRKAFYVRTAYRNDPAIDVGAIKRLSSAIRERRFHTMIENDAAAGTNFQRLASNALERAFKREDRAKTLAAFQDETIGEIQSAMRRLFPDLILNSLGNPLRDRSFMFDKGTSKSFLYKNLSGGEKSAFDLLLDIFVKREEYDDTVFCIDEPEAHMNPRVQGNLLGELFRLINESSQLWIATHAIGMMRRARQLHTQFAGQVVFIDFTDRNFDASEILEPANLNRRFWEHTHEIALDDLAALVAPEQIVICEGTQGDDGLDAKCYNLIFSSEFPDTKFVSAGGKRDLQNYISVVGAVSTGATVFALRDCDQSTAGEAEQLRDKGIRVLPGRKIEDYLLADDVLLALCRANNLASADTKAAELVALKVGCLDIKQAVNSIRQKVISWGVRNAGDTSTGFLRDTVAPLIVPGMGTYDELRSAIFGLEPPV